MAVDPGTRRVGVSISDPDATFALPLTVIARSEDASYIDRLVELISERQAVELVVGLPIRMDGTEGPGASEARALADTLRERLGIPVQLVDERLTTRQATAALSRAGLDSRQQRGRVDSVAATVLLQAFLDTRVAK